MRSEKNFLFSFFFTHLQSKTNELLYKKKKKKKLALVPSLLASLRSLSPSLNSDRMASAAVPRRRRWSRRGAVRSSSAATRLLLLFFFFFFFSLETLLALSSTRGDAGGLGLGLFGFFGADAAAPTPDCQPSLFARMRLDPDLSDFASLLEGVGYRSTLEDKRGGGVGVTVLAPTNSALRAALPSSKSSSFNSSLALFSSVPAAARAAIGGHILRGAIRDDPSSSGELLAQGKWLRTLATAKRPGTADRNLGVSVVGGGPAFLLRSDTGATARATFVPVNCGDALMKLDGVLWPYKL